MFARAAWVISCTWIAIAAVSPATADAWLDSDQLRYYCRSADDVSEPADGMVCVAYVQGFIAGTAVSGGVPTDGAAADAADETLTERAIRTRASSYLRRVENSEAGYCIDDDVPASAVLEALIEHLEANPDDPEVTTEYLVHQALIQRFPCTE